MGWTEYHATYYKNGKIDRKAECDAYFVEGLNRGFYELLKSSMVGSTYYAAVRPLKKSGGKDENGEYIYVDIPENEQMVFAAVFLTSTNIKDYYNFAYKNMDESCGPCQCECPKGILDLLTPTENEFANGWRKRCYENLGKKKDKNSLGKLPIGSEIKFTLYDGKEYTAFKHRPAYQFKRPFWMLINADGYIKTKNIPEDYEVIKRGDC